MLQPALLTMAMMSPVLWLYTLATSFTPLLHPLTERLLQQPCRPAALLARADDQQPPLARHVRGAPLLSSLAAQTKPLHPAPAALELTAWLERLDGAVGFFPMGRVALEGHGAPR